MKSTLKIHKSEKAISEQDIKDLENRFKLKLPKELREFYLKFNGGYPEKREFVLKNGKRIGIHSFYSVKFGKTTLEKTLNDFLTDEPVFFPQNMIPFAYDPGAFIFCIATDEENKGNVFFWQHTKLGTDKELLFLSSSLNKFLDSLIGEEQKSENN